jgi:SSS family solute:Na+ symporter
MLASTSVLHWIVLVLYFGGTMAMGFYFYRRTRSVEDYTAGNLSIYLNSISYLALP